MATAPTWAVVVGFILTMAWILGCVGVWFKSQGKWFATPALLASLLPIMLITAYLIITSPPY